MQSKRGVRSTRVAPAVLGVAALAATAPVELRAELEEIVVTAQRRAQTLDRVPLSVSAITSDDIELRGIRDFASYLAAIPGASMQDTSAVGGEIKFRGIGPGQNAQMSPTTAIYLGEVPVIHTGRNVNASYNFWLVDLDRIEVLRGPQGQLFGSNSLSGAIRNIPVRAQLDGFDAAVNITGSGTSGGAENWDGDVALNMPLIEDQLALRLIAYAAHDGGWYDNKFAGTDPLGTLPVTTTPPAPPPFSLFPLVAQLEPAALDYATPPPRRARNTNATDIRGARIMLRWEPGTRTRADLMAVFEDRDTKGAAFAEYANPLTFAFLPFATPPDIDLRRHEHFQTSTEGQSDKISLFNLVLEYDFDAATLTSSTSYWDRTEELALSLGVTSFLINGIPNTIPLVSYRTDNPQVITQELRLTSTHEGRIDWLAGVFWQEIDQRHRVFGQDLTGLDLRYWRDVAAATVFPPQFAPPMPTTTTLADNQARYRDEQFAVFGQLGYRVTETVHAAFSFRWFDLDQSFRSTSLGFQFGLAQGEQSGVNSEQVFTPRFELSWTPTDDHFYYASAAEGFRTGIINRDVPPLDCGSALVGAGFPDGLPPTTPDTVWSYELGTRLALLDRRLRLNATAFYVDWSDLQMNFPLSAFGPPGGACAYDAVANVGDARSSGIEVEATALLGERLRLDLAFGYTDAQFTSDVPQLNVLDGAKIPFTPETTFYAALLYDLQVGGRPGFARIEWQYVGDKEPLGLDFPTFQYPAGVPFRIGDHHVVNLRAGLDLTESLRAEIFANNVFDEFGVTNASTTGGLGYPFVTTIRPRTLGATLRWRF